MPGRRAYIHRRCTVLKRSRGKLGLKYNEWRTDTCGDGRLRVQVRQWQNVVGCGGGGLRGGQCLTKQVVLYRRLIVNPSRKGIAVKGGNSPEPSRPVYRSLVCTEDILDVGQTSRGGLPTSQKGLDRCYMSRKRKHLRRARGPAAIQIGVMSLNAIIQDQPGRAPHCSQIVRDKSDR